MIGLAELRGLALGLQSFRPLAGKTAVVTGAAGVRCSVMARDLLKAGDVYKRQAPRNVPAPMRMTNFFR